MSPHAYTEDQLVEQPAIGLFAELGWSTVSAMEETFGATGTLQRETKDEVVLVRRLGAALERLNPALPPEAIASALDELTRDRSAMSLEGANRDVYLLLKEGIRVSVPDRERGGQKTERLRVVDWENPANNDFLLVSQFSVTGALYTCRPDLVGFVNGLPLVVIELKKPGVFWQTQGSGKSFAMVFFAQKVLRKVVGNWTFVVVTDRVELDEQIATTFKATGAVSEAEGDQCHAVNGVHLRDLLRGNHRYVFTLIHKFQSPELLCDRPDVIVLTDEAHRSQYDTLALNMRAALPRALFLAFTGTPLIAGEERTREVFGDYVSIYDFQQSVEDGATVPLFYENRTPELQLINPDLNEKIYDLIEAAELDPEQETKLERELSRRYHILTRDDRLETVARDIVRHFLGRGFVGKAMVVSIDKPMRNHTLMQTIARANRVFPGKHSGVIVDYANVFASLEKALAIYGAGKGGQNPVRDKQKLVEELRSAVDSVTRFCAGHQVLLSGIEQLAAGSLERLQSIEDALNALISPDPLRREFFGHERLVSTLYGAVKPDPVAIEFAGRVACLATITQAMRARLNPNPPDISQVMGGISDLLDESITGMTIREQGPPALDLSRINFEALAQRFKQSRHRNTDLEVLKAAIRAQLDKLIRLNRTRADFAEKFEALIESYNAGSRNIEELFEELVKLCQSLSEEQQRHVRENMSEEELVIFDILTRPAPELSTEERAEVKKVARALLERLKQLLVLNWRQKSTARSRLKLAIEDALDAGLPRAYTPELYQQKCSAVFEHIYESYPERHQGIYAVTGSRF